MTKQTTIVVIGSLRVTLFPAVLRNKVKFSESGVKLHSVFMKQKMWRSSSVILKYV